MSDESDDWRGMCGELMRALRMAKIQIEYLHSKFGETGSGNAAIKQIKNILAKVRS